MHSFFRSVLLFASILLVGLPGAHYLRVGEPGLAAAFCGLCVLGMTRRTWVRPVFVAVLLAATILWFDTGAEFVRFRIATDREWMRLAAIMAGLAGASLGCAAMVAGPAGKQVFDKRVPHAIPRATTFLLTSCLLLLVRAKAPFPVLLADRFTIGGTTAWGGVEIFLAALYSQWLTAQLLSPPTHRRLRPFLWAGFSCVFFLQLGLGLGGIDRLLMTGNLHLPVPALIVAGPLFRGDGFFMLILLGVSILLLGPAWCSHLCYIGAWDDLASRTSAQSGRKEKSGAAPGWYVRLLPRARPFTLLLTCGAALCFRAAGVPAATAVWYAAGFGLAGLAVMALVSRRLGLMAHCTLFCPIGWVTNVLGKVSPWRIRLGAECTRCRICAGACRYGALQPADIDSGRPGPSCTLCGDCVAACPHNTMQYTLYGRPASSARTVFICLAAILHTLFLLTARL